MPIIPVEVVNEDSSCRVRFLLCDFDGAPIAPTSIISATLNLKDKITDAAIGVADRNVKDKFTTGQIYNFAYVFDDADNAIKSTNSQLRFEVHVVKLDIQVDDGGGGTLYHEEEIYIKVERHCN